MLWLIPVLLAAGTIDPALLRYSLPGAGTLIGVRMSEVRDTPFGRYVLARIAGEGREFEEFISATGFDPRKQIEDAVFSSASGGKWLVAARGSFPRATLARVAQGAGAEIEELDGVQFVAAAKGAADSPIGRPIAFALLSESLALAGDEGSVRQAIERRSETQGPPAALASRAQEAAAAYPVWFAVREFPEPRAGETPLSGEVLKQVESASGGLQMGAPMMFHARLLATGSDAAASLASVLRFVVQLAGAPGQNSPAATPLSEAQVSHEDRTVSLSMPVTVELIEAFVEGERAAGETDQPL